VYQVGINKGIILRCTAYQISRITRVVRYVTTRQTDNFASVAMLLAFSLLLAVTSSHKKNKNTRHCCQST